MPRARPRSRWQLLALAAAVAAIVWLAVANLRLSLLGAYSLDEFQYAHAGWRIARGETIYRDFFEHHFPLLHQLLGVAWRFLDDDPDNLQTLRLLMLPVPLLMILAGGVVNRRACGRWTTVTAAVLLAVPTLSSMALQVRPDPLAAALFLAALAVLYPSRLAPRWRGLVAGALFVAALWTTLKVAYYGLVLVAALVADLLAYRRDRRTRAPALLGDPVFFLAGCALAALPIALYLTLSGSWEAWYRWCVAFSFAHQWHYPGFAWQGNLEQLVRHAWWLPVFAAVGVASTIGALRRAGRRGDPDLLLLGALVTTFVSFVWQSAPYLYSLVPFTLVLGVFAARGLVATARRLGTTSRLPAGERAFALALLALLVLGQLRTTDFAFAKMAADDNVAQRARLARLGAMTVPEEPVFHVWGGQISRPAVHYFYFLEAVTMRLEDARLRAELVPAMIEKGVTVYLHHDLFPRLVPELRAYLLANFLPYDPGIWVWGRRFSGDDRGGDGGDRNDADDGTMRGDFVAVRDGRYFVWPPDALGAGAELTLRGRRTEAPVVALERGLYPLEYRGPARELFLVWLPADGRPFAPRPELLPDG